jgi:hypothetical protein
MLSVGIHENLRIHKTALNDRGTLIIGIKEESAGDSDLLSMINAVSDSSGSEGRDQDFLVYGPLVNNREGNLDTPDVNAKKVIEIKALLTHILLGYLPSDKIKWDIIKDCGIDATNIKEKHQDQGVLDQMYKNMVTQFIEMMRPFIGDKNKRFRMLFIRQSAQKHFPALRKRYLNEQPFMEPMSVPKEQSKLKYSKWEIANNYN